MPTIGEQMMQVGLKILQLAQAGSQLTGQPLDESAFIKAMNYILGINEAPNPEPEIAAVGLARWALCGFPVVEMGHKFAASLIVSNISDEMMESLRMPWPSFVIAVPNGLIEIMDGDRRAPIQRVMVTQIPGLKGDWCYVAYAGPELGVTVWRHGVDIKHLLAGMADVPNVGDLEFTDLDDRAQMIIGRLIVTTCAAMTMPDLVKETGPGHKTHTPGEHNPQRIPMVPRIFKLGKPITLDFRDRVKEFAEGRRDGSKIEVRTMVMGHFKRQRHGEGRQQMKTIWIEAYWRGDEDMPVLIRPHVLKDGESVS